MGAQVLLPRRVQRRLRRLPRPDRLPRLHGRQPLRGRERLRSSKAPGGRCRGPATATTWATSTRPSSDMNTLELVLGTNGPVGRPVGHLAGGLLARRRRRLSEADLGQAHGRHRPRRGRATGATTTTCRYILRRDWATLGPKLRGKLHIYVGDMDNYYLNNAVYLVEEFLKTAKTRRTRARSTTAIAPSTAGTATTRSRTPSRACATTRCSRRRSSSGC